MSHIKNEDVVAVQTRYGRMFVPVHDVYIGKSLQFYGEYFEQEIALFSQIVKPGMMVLDVGANIGATAIPLCQFTGPGGQVSAYEPEPDLFKLLHINCNLNAIKNAMLYNVALGAYSHSAKMPKLDLSQPGNFGGGSVGIGDVDVPVLALDGVAGQCHFMKVDAEGHEYEVLQGAQKLIMRERPILYVENDRTEKSSALIKTLFNLDYRVFWHLPNAFNPDNFNGETTDIFNNMVAINMFCFPRNFEAQVDGFKEVTAIEDLPFQDAAE